MTCYIAGPDISGGLVAARLVTCFKWRVLVIWVQSGAHREFAWYLFSIKQQQLSVLHSLLSLCKHCLAGLHLLGGAGTSTACFSSLAAAVQTFVYEFIFFFAIFQRDCRQTEHPGGIAAAKSKSDKFCGRCAARQIRWYAVMSMYSMKH